MLTCDQAREALLVPEEAAPSTSLETHLAACLDCARFHRSHTALDEQLQSALVLEPPAWLTQAVLTEIAPAKASSAVAPWTERLQLTQWAVYVGLFATLWIGINVQELASMSWLADLSTLPVQLVAAYEILTTMWFVLSLDVWLVSLVDSTWVYGILTLAILAWWLREGEPRREMGS